MTFKKGDSVTFTHPKTGIRQPAIVELSTAKNLTINYDAGDNDGLRVFTTERTRHAPEQLVEFLKITKGTSLPMSEKLKNDQKMLAGNTGSLKKGDVVSFDLDGTHTIGRVMKGGKNPRVSTRDGHADGPAFLFTPCDPVPVSGDERLADWDVENFVNEGTGTDGYRFRAKVTYQGTPVFYAIEDGSGAPELRYEPVSRDKDKYIDRFRSDLKAYLSEKGVEVITADLSWPRYQHYVSVSGTSFADYLKILR